MIILAALIWFLLGAVAGAVVAIVASVVLAALERDVSARGAYVFLLFFTVPIASLIGGLLGVSWRMCQ